MAYVSLKPGEQLTPEALAAFVAPLIAERPAVPKRIEILATIPLTAVGKVYKPALRALATRQVLQAHLLEQQLGARARVAVDEVPSGFAVTFTVQDADTEAAVRALMKPLPCAMPLREGRQQEPMRQLIRHRSSPQRRTDPRPARAPRPSR